MKKFSARRFLLILLPSLALFVLVTKAMFFPARGYSAQVTRLPPANGKTYQRSEVDTRIVVTFNYSQFRELRNRFKRGGTLHAMGRFYLEDDEFNQYAVSTFTFTTFNFSGWHKVGANTYSITCEFPLYQLPEVAKNVTLHTSVSDGDGWTLPISVPLNR